MVSSALLCTPAAQHALTARGCLRERGPVRRWHCSLTGVRQLRSRGSDSDLPGYDDGDWLVLV